MGRNLLTVIDGERADVKVIVWQANAHVGRAFRFSEDPTLGDLVTDTPGAYTQLVVGLATDAPRRAALRERLAATLPRTSLLDPGRFAAQLEDVYREACARHLAEPR